MAPPTPQMKLRGNNVRFQQNSNSALSSQLLHGVVVLKKRSATFQHLQLHGATDIINSDTLGCRVFWISAVVIATGLAIWMCALIVSRYATNPTVTKLDFKPPEIRYPYLTICPDTMRVSKYFLVEDRLRVDKVPDTAVSLMLLSGPVWILTESDIPGKSIFRDRNATKFRKNLEKTAGPSPAKQLLEFFKKYGLRCNELFHSCRNANWHKVDCCKLFRPVFNFQHGLCFANDPKKMPMVNAPGLFSNFYIKFKRPNLWRNPARPLDTVKTNSSLDIAIDAAVDQGIWRADTIPLLYGNWGLVRLAAKNVRKGTWSKDCNAQERLCYFDHFTFSNCMWERMFLASPVFFNPRDCLLPMIHLTHLGFNLNHSEHNQELSDQPDPDSRLWTEFSTDCQRRLSRPYCRAEEVRDLLYKHIDEPPDYKEARTYYGITYWMNKYNISDRNPCREPCNHWEYTYTYSFEEEEELGDQFAGITLTFPEAEYAEVTEMRALEWFDYVALIGGVWGLWIGASIVTGIQLVVYTVRLCFDPQRSDIPWWTRYRRRKKHTSAHFKQLSFLSGLARSLPDSVRRKSSQSNGELLQTGLKKGLKNRFSADFSDVVSDPVAPRRVSFSHDGEIVVMDVDPTTRNNVAVHKSGNDQESGS